MFQFLKIFKATSKASTILIYADMEGICGVTDWEEVTPGTSSYFLAQQQMTKEVNAAIRGAFNGGAKRVLVNDLHWYYDNLLWHSLDPRVEICRGPNLMLPIFEQEKIDGIFLLGLHAMANTKNAILPHTWALPDHLDALFVNKKQIGEIGMIAYASAQYHIPILLITGDDACLKEAEQLIDCYEKVSVKTMKNNQPICESSTKKIKVIEQAAKKAIKKFIKNKVSIPEISEPFEFQLIFPTEKMAKLAEKIQFPVVRKNKKIIFQTNHYQQGLNLFFNAVALTFV